MPQRAATEYVYARLSLVKADMPRFAALCDALRVRIKVCVLDNGNQELVLSDEIGGESVRLTLVDNDDRYTCLLSCRITRPGLAQALNRALAAFRGDAMVNRIYRGFVITYHYLDGKVARIVEKREGEPSIIFERRLPGQPPADSLEALFRMRTVEERIAGLRREVDELLDRRNRAADAADIAAIDLSLKERSLRLFALEA